MLILKHHPDIVRSQTEWNVIFALLRSTISHTEASRQSFDILSSLAQSTQGLVTIDNYTGLVNAFDEFATAASVAVDAQQQGRRSQTLTAARSALYYNIPQVECLTLFSSPIVERGRKAVDLIADLKRCWARFSQSSSVPNGQSEVLYS